MPCTSSVVPATPHGGHGDLGSVAKIISFKLQYQQLMLSSIHFFQKNCLTWIFVCVCVGGGLFREPPFFIFFKQVLIYYYPHEPLNMKNFDLDVII